MKKIVFFFITVFALTIEAKADHITGGEIFYTYSTNPNGTINYQCTFKLFMRCNSGRQFNNPTVVSIFDKGTNQRVMDRNVSLSSSEIIRITDPDPCVSDPPQVCYVVGYYKFNVDLPATANGYLLSSQVNYRIQGINNLQTFYSNIGATYTAEIPGNPAALNNSAKFTGNDLVVVCSNNRFAYSFGATDPDGDELRYSFCEAYRSGIIGNNVIAPPSPPYQSVPYGNGFSGTSPLGQDVQINPETGLITGIAPPTGVYVVTVCVEEIRDGKVIARQRKDLQINIAPCKIAAAILPPEYLLCKDTKTINLVNLSNSPLIRTYYWELTNKVGTIVFTSTEETPSYTFTDTGIYHIKLAINRGESCKDSTTSLARVYPGFVPGFNFTGICISKPTQFNDVTTSKYGEVNLWNWSFSTGDTSNAQNPAYTFKSIQNYNVSLIVDNTVGCRDTITKPVAIVSKPPVKLAFKDTLICKGDAVTLHAEASGVLLWRPDYNIADANSSSPTVSPTATTRYTVDLNDNGCLNQDTVLVRVTDHVELQVMNDTTICSTDTIRLRIRSDAFTYSWTPSAQLVNSTVADPYAFTSNNTTYQVKANIGSCLATGNITVSTVSYPSAFAGKDTVICYNSFAQLRGVTNAASVNWTPAIGLNNANISNPVATPARTTDYVFLAYDNKGCPKPGRDTVTVIVLPPIEAFAGNDTTAIVEQPLQLNATGGVRYLWTPNIGLSASNISNPVAIYTEPYNEVKYKVVILNEASCADSAFVTVKVFNTGPTVFVPTAFTPNGDGKNDILRPISVGMKHFDFFRVYNRWGQEVFNTQIDGRGWDGTVNGIIQTTGTYVWAVKAIDYKGTPFFKKGTVTLIK